MRRLRRLRGPDRRAPSPPSRFNQESCTHISAKTTTSPHSQYIHSLAWCWPQRCGLSEGRQLVHRWPLGISVLGTEFWPFWKAALSRSICFSSFFSSSSFISLFFFFFFFYLVLVLLLVCVRARARGCVRARVCVCVCVCVLCV